MKSFKLLILVLFTFAFMGGQSAYAITQEEIRSKNSEFKKNLEIDIQEYDDALIKNIYLEHRQKEKKSGLKDYLYVKGSFKNSQRSILAGAHVRARFYDANGNLVAVEEDAVIPRIMRQYRKNRGHFTIKIPYDSNIVLCRLDATWSGQEDE